MLEKIKKSTNCKLRFLMIMIGALCAFCPGIVKAESIYLDQNRTNASVSPTVNTYQSFQVDHDTIITKISIQDYTDTNCVSSACISTSATTTNCIETTATSSVNILYGHYVDYEFSGVPITADTTYYFYRIYYSGTCQYWYWDSGSIFVYPNGNYNGDPIKDLTFQIYEEYCGNNVVENTESCDDGNAVDDDSCHNDCTANADYCAISETLYSNNDLSIINAVSRDSDNVTTRYAIHIPFLAWFVLAVPILWIMGRVVLELIIRMRQS